MLLGEGIIVDRAAGDVALEGDGSGGRRSGVLEAAAGQEGKPAGEEAAAAPAPEGEGSVGGVGVVRGRVPGEGDESGPAALWTGEHRNVPEEENEKGGSHEDSRESEGRGIPAASDHAPDVARACRGDWLRRGGLAPPEQGTEDFQQDAQRIDPQIL